MTALALSDCLRATPSRTLAALTAELVRRTVRAAQQSPASCAAAGLSDHTLADIGLSRTALVHAF